ncbi:MAG: aldo/keto reductase [Armatimonadetes bacterium]|nr:aldo/keto reductase [Armatimonadota bacterium]
MADYEREEIFLTSKVWPEDMRHDDLIAACERNLRELRTDYLDLYLLHWPNPQIPMSETLGALAELVERGMARSVGVSNFTRARLAEALEISPVPLSNNQFELHPLLYQRELVDFCHERGVAVTAYCPIARGAVYENEVIGDIADETGHTCAQVSLRWLLQKGCVVIPRSSNPTHIEENLDILDWELDDEQMARIDAIEEYTRLIRTEEYNEFED